MLSISLNVYCRELLLIGLAVIVGNVVKINVDASFVYNSGGSKTGIVGLWLGMQ